MRMSYKILVLSLFCTALSYPQDSNKVMQKSAESEVNYLVGVKSDNFGLKVSSAYYLGEMKSEKAVIPLMEILRSDTSASARIMAALSLYKIGDARGLHAIKQAIQFDSDEQVKKMCTILTQMHDLEKNK
jgi:hypothetical protein